MTQQTPPTRRHISFILGIVSVAVTLMGLLTWSAVYITSLNQPINVIVNGGNNGESPQADLPVVVVEEQPAANSGGSWIPLLLTSLGAFTSFGALVLEWRKDKRESQEDDLALRLQKIDLELKKLQLQKMRQELEKGTE